MTTTSYELSKKLKTFMGKDAPEPIDKNYWTTHLGKKIYLDHYEYAPVGSAAYTLEDLLSKPFCEVMAKRTGMWHMDKQTGLMFGRELFYEYSEGGFPAVEAELVRLMGDK